MHCLEQHLDRNVANPKVRLESLSRTSQGDFQRRFMVIHVAMEPMMRVFLFCFVVLGEVGLV